MKKYLALILMLAAACSAATLEELIEQAQSAGAVNFVEICNYLNAPQGYDTNSVVTNVYLKPVELQVVEGSILAELSSVGISTNAATSNGWAYIITELDSIYEAAADTNKQGVLKSSLLLLAGYEQLKTIVPDGPTITSGDFGKPTATIISPTRTPNPSLAVQHLGHGVTRSEVMK